jgi:hypothetical protein
MLKTAFLQESPFRFQVMMILDFTDQLYGARLFGNFEQETIPVLKKTLPKEKDL